MQKILLVQAFFLSNILNSGQFCFFMNQLLHFSTFFSYCGNKRMFQNQTWIILLLCIFRCFSSVSTYVFASSWFFCCCSLRLYMYVPRFKTFGRHWTIFLSCYDTLNYFALWLFNFVLSRTFFCNLYIN